MARKSSKTSAKTSVAKNPSTAAPKKTAPFHTPGPYRIWFRRSAVAPDFVAAIGAAVSRVELLNARLADELGFGREQLFGVDDKTGELSLDMPDDSRVRAETRLVGTFYKGTWQWSWADPSVAKERVVEELRALGQEKRWD